MTLVLVNFDHGTPEVHLWKKFYVILGSITHLRMIFPEVYLESFIGKEDLKILRRVFGGRKWRGKMSIFCEKLFHSRTFRSKFEKNWPTQSGVKNY